MSKAGSRAGLAADSHPDPRARHHRVATRAAHGQFAAFVLLALAAPSLTRGPFTWLPVFTVSNIADDPVGVGPLSVLPASLGLAWLVARLLERPPRRWLWGRPGVTLPLAGLTLLMLLSLEPALNHRTLVVLLTLALLWSIYFFVVNEKPNLTAPLALVVIIQGSVALGQFVCQSDLGISLLGEPVLDPQLSGISVLWARESRWLRAYGLTGHPSLLGGTLGVLLLLLADDIAEARGLRQLWFTLVASIGLLGLLTTFSRSAWIAFGLGLLAWFLRRTVPHQERAGSGERRQLLRKTQLLVPALVAALFLLLHYDLVASRFLQLDTPLEARSIHDRQRDADLAIQLIRRYPWRGVGVRNYLVAVRAIEPDSRAVHNVLLLTAAELGLPGAALWSWLALTGLLHPLSAAWAPWSAMLVTTVFDIGLSMTNSWYATVVFALLSAHVSLPARVAQLPRVEDRERLRKDRRLVG
jgi:hypothetical protein